MKLHMTDVVVSRLKDCGTYFDESTPAFGLRIGTRPASQKTAEGRLQNLTLFKVD